MFSIDFGAVLHTKCGKKSYQLTILVLSHLSGVVEQTVVCHFVLKSVCLQR